MKRIQVEACRKWAKKLLKENRTALGYFNYTAIGQAVRKFYEKQTTK